MLAVPENLRVTARDANSSTVAWTERLTNAVTGQVTQQNHSYVMVGTGLNYQDESGAWRESRDLIELLPDGSAAALRGPNKVGFNPNLNTPDAVRITTFSNRVFRASILGIYYFDAATGQSALVATVQDAIGEFLPPNQIVYRDSFKGLKADVRVTFTKSAFESDLILLEDLEIPLALGNVVKDKRLGNGIDAQQDLSRIFRGRQQIPGGDGASRGADRAQAGGQQPAPPQALH